MTDHKTVMQQAYRLGFLRCAGWAQRDDLFADVDSPTYKKDCQHDLSAIAQPVEPAEPIVWCQYIAGMIETYLQMSPKLENRESAIASIIERRLMHLSQPAHVPETDCGNISQPVEPCTGCNGHGEVGGLSSDGYHSEICPYCKGDGTEQIASAKGPENLWLQLHGDCTDDETRQPVDYENDGVTWCWHAIHDSDVRYVRADLVRSEQPAQEQNFCPRCGKRLGGTDDIHTCTAPAHLNLSKQTVEKLHKFLDASAGDGVISDGVDAADLYIEIFPEQYAESAK